MPEARRLVWSPKAEDDLRSIWRYFARVASREVGDNLLRDIKSAAIGLAERPFLLGRPRDEIRSGLRSALVSPHVVFYRVTDATVEIVRVLHQARNASAQLANDAT